jgi:hypothetical protein
MELPVWVEPVNGTGFRATVGPPFNWMAEGATEEEAVMKLQTEAIRHNSNGGRVASIKIPDENPWLRIAGTWDPNDPLYEEWRKAIEEYRQSIDDDPNVL